MTDDFRKSLKPGDFIKIEVATRHKERGIIQYHHRNALFSKWLGNDYQNFFATFEDGKITLFSADRLRPA